MGKKNSFEMPTTHPEPPLPLSVDTEEFSSALKGVWLSGDS